MNQDYCSLEVLHRNALPARSWFLPFGDVREAKASRNRWGKDSCRVQLLSGTWKFRYATSPESAPPPGEPCADWDEIAVPSCWQALGYEPPFYVNDDFTCPATPPNVPVYTPVGVYRRAFTPHPLNDGRAILSFLGVCSAYDVWLNGVYVGYSQGSHNTGEFDVTESLRPGENEIAVYVYKWCDGSYLESQDMFRYNGIFRDVTLTYVPAVSIFDYRFGSLIDGGGSAHGRIELVLRGGKAATRAVLERDGERVWSGESTDGVFEFTLRRPALWSAETPNLYDLYLSVETDGLETECVHARVGFKTTDYRGPEFRVNGAPVKLKGVNMHESHYRNGYVMTDEECERDIALAKSLNVNTIRFSHYPPNPVMLALCDEYGVYAIDEADLESYGAVNMENIDYFGQSVDWLPAFLDRMERLFERDKNHACVVMWSMGNEAGRGQNFDRCYEWLKAKDPATAVHYETCFRYAGEKGYDLVSLQYSDFAEIERRMRADDPRPFFLCEYGHCMGPGPGSLKEYWDAVYAEPKFVGGCIWEWCDHAWLATRDERDPAKYDYTYGGDHGEYIHDGNFCCDGMVYPDRSLSPAAFEIKNVYRPLRFRLAGHDEKGCIIEAFNTNSFLGADRYLCRFRFKSGGNVVREEERRIALAAGERTEIACDFSDDGAERVLEIETYLRQTSVGLDSLLLEERLPAVRVGGSPRVREEGKLIRVETGETIWTYDRYLRTVTSMKVAGKELVAANPRNKGFGTFCRDVGGWIPAVWRASIDNDRPFADAWNEMLYHEFWTNLDVTETGEEAGAFVVRNSGLLTPPKYAAMYGLETEYRFDAGGMRVRAALTALRDGLPPLPKFGMRVQLAPEFDNAVWYGRGLRENYPDFVESAGYGVYRATAELLHEPYIRPQENGSRGGVRWLEVTNGDGAGLRIVPIGKPAAFSLKRYSTEMLQAARHRSELGEAEFCELGVDGFTRGLGSAACGMPPLAEYTIPLTKKGDRIEFEFSAQGICAKK